MADKFIIIKNGYILSHNDDDCFINGKEVEKASGDKRTNLEILEELKSKFYNDNFKKYYKNIVVLTAAGTSIDNGANRGMSRVGLWKECDDEIQEIFRQCPNIKAKKFETDSDIEGLLTALILHEKVNSEVLDSSSEKILGKIEVKIANACRLVLDKSKAPHLEFLNKITSRNSNDPRVQIFTTNYDTLFEQASNDGGFIMIDGFSFTQPRKFSGRYYDVDIVNREKSRLKQEESFIQKVFHLYKLHGSLNWVKENEDILLRENPLNPLVIYPASEKYESSYEQPYFEMMSRFQQALRKENTLLFVIGFGFQDKHIQNVIKEAVNQNTSFQLVIVNYNSDSTISTDFLEDFFIDVTSKEIKRNVTIIFDTFRDYTKHFPDNLTYTIKENESI